MIIICYTDPKIAFVAPRSGSFAQRRGIVPFWEVSDIGGGDFRNLQRFKGGTTVFGLIPGAGSRNPDKNFEDKQRNSGSSPGGRFFYAGTAAFGIQDTNDRSFPKTPCLTRFPWRSYNLFEPICNISLSKRVPQSEKEPPDRCRRKELGKG